MTQQKFLKKWDLLLKLVCNILVFFIKVYRFVLAPVLPDQCRFHPSCSGYAIEALKKHGPFKGSVLTVRRILKCHPWNPGGYDPVP